MVYSAKQCNRPCCTRAITCRRLLRNATMLPQTNSYDKPIATGSSVLLELITFVRQAHCDELGCNMHPSMMQLGWCSTLHDRQCSTSRVATCRAALQHVAAAQVGNGRQQERAQVGVRASGKRAPSGSGRTRRRGCSTAGRSTTPWGW